MKLFEGYRPNPPEGYKEGGLANEAEQPQYQGVVWNDGTVTLRWMTAFHSTSNFDSFGDFYSVHGHPEYGTVVSFVDLGYDGIMSTEDINKATDF